MAAAAASRATPIGLADCTTSCGNVSVPYPFGFGPPHCYWPGLNLTCNTTGPDPPRLLLGDGTFRVAEISLRNTTIRVIRTGSIFYKIDITTDRNVSFGEGFTGHGYRLSSGNELVLSGCNLMATLREDLGPVRSGIVSGCASFCSFRDKKVNSVGQPTGKYCSGMACCQAPINYLNSPTGVHLRWLDPGNHSEDLRFLPTYVFVAEEGWFDRRPLADELLSVNRTPSRAALEVPLVLQWGVKQELPLMPQPDLPFHDKTKACSGEVHRMLCKSENSVCVGKSLGYTCQCQDGFDGNPYLAGGCQDINECEHPQDYGCFGECINTGGHKCQCPRGTHGYHTLKDGCIKFTSTGVSIIIGLGSAAGFLLLVLVGIFATRRIKHKRERMLKQKFFKQNRGQLLQQLVSQRADIAEKMIISIDELAKATNNFDKARELGGVGHGTVYKGILSDLHVVAIKKSKITVKREIDEFINEVAILSQINHRNVVKLLGCSLETEVPLLVYEFISNGTLYQHLHVEGPKSLSWMTRLRVATEIASALAYLHSSLSIPIIHRDIKSSNILLDDTMTSKVSDFGASRYFPMDKTALTTMIQGTVGYLDPMYFYTGRLTERSDVYSFGVILVELLTRKRPCSYLFEDGVGLVSHFVDLLAEQNMVQILDPQVIEEGGQEVQEVSLLAASCIKLNGEERPTIREVEHTLEGLLSKKCIKNNTFAEEIEGADIILLNCSSSKREGQSMLEFPGSPCY